MCQYLLPFTPTIKAVKIQTKKGHTLFVSLTKTLEFEATEQNWLLCG